MYTRELKNGKELLDNHFAMKRPYLILKRLFDIIGAIVLLPFVLLVICVFAPVIWFTDRGPVFYNALRVKQGYKPFRMYKLRSMYVNSPDLKNPDGSTFNSDNDSRVTPIGRFLRKTSLDEFPQVLNILLGDMSFIGPRPKIWDAAKTIGDMDETRRKSYSVKPGITGFAQAYFRNSITQDEKFKWDAYYADNISFCMDIKILWRTMIAVLGRENINTEQSYKKQ